MRGRRVVQRDARSAIRAATCRNGFTDDTPRSIARHRRSPAARAPVAGGARPGHPDDGHGGRRHAALSVQQPGARLLRHGREHAAGVRVHRHGGRILHVSALVHRVDCRGGRPARHDRAHPHRRCPVHHLPRPADVGDAPAGHAGLRLWRPQARTQPADLHSVDRGARRIGRHADLRRDRAVVADECARQGVRMSPALIGVTGVSVLFALLILRVPIWIALVLVGFFGNVTVLGWQGAFALAGTAPFDVASSYTLSVVPLFILMGEVASQSRLSGELFKAARVILSGFRGGLAIATLAASALFGAVSGSSLANAATMTRIALPELRKAGYDDGLATGCIAAGGSTDIL